MKKILLFVMAAGFVMCGCQEAENGHTEKEVDIEHGGGEGSFPDYLAGRWVAKKQGFQMVISSDGKITAATASFGKQFIVLDDESTQKGLVIYEPGEWTLEYDPDTKNMKAVIEMDGILLDMGPNVMEGSSVDYYEGPVENGVWRAEWTYSTELYTFNKDNPVPVEIPPDPEQDEAKEVLFIKQAE